MSTKCPPTIQLPEGYTVSDRLGAGGYGEVWKATAPGGVEKAVKVVFGHCDEDLAERELKALDRVRSVRHPFLLSIERYEVVNNRLVIVTELADMSLDALFQRHCAEGRTGIPRDELIGYLWDTAEALDWLSERYKLQHLDIKPENLLVVGDHIKVADFGLVKDIASRTLNSMVGGMTPVYSAPEIYDNDPSPRSDQYSLAIVYQQMLTGTLPFPGRTPAQLAKQHTQSAPNLQPLSDFDRRVVGRALEKKPSDRFASCREFVSALNGSEHFARAGGSDGQRSTASSGDPSEDDTKPVASLNTEPVGQVPAAELSPMLTGHTLSSLSFARKSSKRTTSPPLRPFPEVSPEILDEQAPPLADVKVAAPPPTLLVAVGGMGLKMMTHLRQRIDHLDPEGNGPGNLAWLAIDTDRDALGLSVGSKADIPISRDDLLHTPLRRPKQYREESKDLLRWVSRRWLYNIPRSLQTRGFRPLGRIAVVDHAEAVLRALDARLQGLVSRMGDEPQASPVRVVLLAGMSGGTGAGAVIDLAQAARSVSRELNIELHVQGMLGCTFLPEHADSLAAANMFSLLTELHHAQHNGNCGDSPPPTAAAHYELPTRPFDDLYIVPIPSRNEPADRDATLRSCAHYLALEAATPAGAYLDSLRAAAAGADSPFALRTLHCLEISRPDDSPAAEPQDGLLHTLLRYWLADTGKCEDPDAGRLGAYANTRFAESVLREIPPIYVDPDRAEESSTLAKHRAALVRRGVAALVPLVEAFGARGDAPPAMDAAELAALSGRIVQELCASLCTPADSGHPGDLLKKVVAKDRGAAGGTDAGAAENENDSLASQILSRADARPLNCGYRRRMLLLAPQASQQAADPNQADAVESLARTLPTAGVARSAVGEAYLISEGSDLAPLHLAARLAENYPDIEEASGRLHSRDDIAWTGLRQA